MHAWARLVSCPGRVWLKALRECAFACVRLRVGVCVCAFARGRLRGRRRACAFAYVGIP